MKALRPVPWKETAVLVVGCLAMFGHLTGFGRLKMLGLATAASPYPKVFCDAPVYGREGEEIETFASAFTLSYRLEGKLHEIPITPERYAGIRGPYNRRNVYGAVLSYAPALPPEMWQGWFARAFREPGALKAELGVPEHATAIQVRIDSQTAGRPGTWTLQ